MANVLRGMSDDFFKTAIPIKDDLIKMTTYNGNSGVVDDLKFAASHSGWWGRTGEAHDLTQVMAGFWLARNEALTKAAMGPAEYTWLYGLAYFGWLGHDPAAGRQAMGISGGSGSRSEEARFAGLRDQWKGGVSAGAAPLLEPLRARLVAGWTEETNPIDLVFIGGFEKAQEK